jgi:polyisoprenyl-teichoic acid--peptidoglycan teichoic acid transferase
MTKNLFKLAGCFFVGVSLFLLIIGVLYFLLSPRSNILILGIDAREDEGSLGRTDTMIVATVDHLKPYIGVLSIPRDLWVVIPGYGENRINTAHFFAESQITGNGPYAAIEVVEYNFGIDVDYFARIQFNNFIELIDIVGGVDIQLENAMSGLSDGEHHLDGEQALSFSRDRSGSDDFFRMERGQLILQALFLKTIKLENWKYIPQLIEAASHSVDTNIPIYMYPRIAFALLRTNPDNIDYRIISREMVIPFTTAGGAAVLAPNWELIHPLIHELFDQ